MKTGDTVMILMDKDGHFFGKANYDRWNKVKWYQKLFGKIFPKYKEKFIDIEGLEYTDDGKGTYEVIYDSTKNLDQ